MRARLRWELYKSLIQDMRSGLRKAKQDYWFPDGEPDQMPEVYGLYQQCHEWNTLWWPGGIADQPHILMMEFDECALAVAEFKAHDMADLQETHKKGIEEHASRRLT